MDDIVGLVGTLYVGDVVTYDIELLDVETRVFLQFHNPFGMTEHEVVETDNLFDTQFLGTLAEEFHEVITEESCAAGDEYGGVFETQLLVSGQAVERVLDVVCQSFWISLLISSSILDTY